MNERLLAPSILSADFGHLADAVDLIDRSEAQWVHLDIMDGLFVPNISYGFPVVAPLRKLTKKPLDAHLMIVDPDRYLARFAELGVDILTVHQEACTHLVRTLSEIRRLGMKAGVAINPGTPPEHLRDVLHVADLVLVMSVNPGFGGQKFIEQTYRRLARLKALMEEENVHPLVEVDGGVDATNARALYEAGANVLVAGNAVFGAPNPEEAIKRILHG